METLRIVGLYDAKGVSDANALVCLEESRTRQEFKEESDINTIIDRFGIGENPIQLQKWVENIDIVEAVSDYQTALNQIVEASKQFNSLPARIRSQFDNDPALFVDFVSNPANNEEMVRLGLAQVRQDPPPSDTDRIISALEKSSAQSSS